jgi:alginate O-acetyltransferase complex protein AlgI
VAATFLLVCVGWVFFRAASLADAGTILGRLLVPSSGLTLAPGVNALVAALVGSVLVAHLIGTFVDVPRAARALPAPVLGAALACGVLAAALLAPDAGGAFIYFQF